MSKRITFVCELVLICLPFYLPSKVSASNINFSKVGNIKYQIASNSLFKLNEDKFFTIAGANSDIIQDSELISVLVNGNIGRVEDKRHVDSDLYWQSGANKNATFYLLGGTNLTYSALDTVWMSKYENSDFVEWSKTSPLPKRLSMGAAIENAGYIYHLGGNLSGDQNPVVNVYFSKILEDGSLEEWKSTQSLPLPSAGMTAIVHNGFIYAIGRQGSGDTFYTRIKEDGSLEPWKFGPSLPIEVFRASIAKVDDVIYVIGGIPARNSFPRNEIFTTTIKPDGTLTDWEESESDFPRSQCCSPAVTIGHRIYIAGGHDGIDYYSEVWMGEVATIQTPTPTPTPTPVIEVTKTILIPGLGGSWNQDALVNCKASQYEGGWSSSPMAGFVYDPVISDFTSAGKQLIPFYYDWRKDARESKDALKQFIAGITVPGERVDLIGHSFGGLVARAYVEESGPIKVRNFLSIGAPNMGLVRAYGAWEAGQIWNDNLIMRVAQTLMLKTCGGKGVSDRQVIQQFFPGVKNLLPTFDYLRQVGSNQMIKISSMINQNNWLPTNYESLLSTVRIGTLSGNGYKTMSELKVTNRSKNDIKKGDWEDGRPVETVNSKAGDDSVLLLSSQLTGADNRVIKQTHWGIMTSPEAISQINSFLGISNKANVHTPSKEPDSAIVILNADGEVDIEGGIGQPGLGVLMGTAKGKHRFNYKANKTNTKVTVLQFLPNGQLLEKEYTFRKAGKYTGRLEFDWSNPKESILKIE